MNVNDEKKIAAGTEKNHLMNPEGRGFRRRTGNIRETANGTGSPSPVNPVAREKTMEAPTETKNGVAASVLPARTKKQTKRSAHHPESASKTNPEYTSVAAQTPRSATDAERLAPPANDMKGPTSPTTLGRYSIPTKTVKSPPASSTRAWRNPNRTPHEAHLPPRKTQESTGMSSIAPRRFPHDEHLLGEERTESIEIPGDSSSDSRRTRDATAPANDEREAPVRNQTKKEKNDGMAVSKSFRDVLRYCHCTRRRGVKQKRFKENRT